MKSISVVIPTYNCAKYIGSAIQSVLNQSVGDIEIIVVDDGSTDDTKDVIQPFMKDVVYVYQENKGLPGARNRGMKEATGEYIAFLDADDRWRENKLDIQVKVLKHFPSVHIVFTDFSTFDEYGNKEESVFRKSFPFFQEYNFDLGHIFSNVYKLSMDQFKREIDIYYGQIAKYLFCGNFILPSSVLMRNSVIDRLGGFDENYRIAEETEYFLRLCTIYDAAYVDFPLVDYLIKRTGKLTGSSNIEYLIKNAIFIQKEYINKHPEIYIFNKCFFDLAIAKSYARLSYCYLSLMKNKEARLEARRSMNFTPAQLQAYSYWLLSFFPPFLLGVAGKFKHSLKGVLRR